MWASALDAALDCVISIDRQGCVTYFNPAAERTFGYRADEVLGRELAEVIVPPSLRKAHRHGLVRHLETGEKRVLDRRIELTAMRADGGEFPAELTVTRVNSPGEEPAFIGYVRDISERARTENEQAALRRVATLIAFQATTAEVFEAVAREVAGTLGVEMTSLVRTEAGTATQVGVWGEQIPYRVGTSWALDEHGVSGLVSRSGQPARVDYAKVPGEIAARLAREAGIRCSAGVPITVEGRLWGVMMVLSSEADGLREDTEERLAAFTELVATAIANADARDELRTLAEEQSALRRVATLVARGAPPREVFDAVCEETGRLMDATTVNLAHFTPDGFNLTMAGWSMKQNHVPTGTRLRLDGETINVIVQRRRAPARVATYDGVEGELAAALRELGIQSGVGAPVIVEDRVWGALIAGTHKPEPLPDGAETRVASFAELIATAVSNAAARSDLIAARRRVIEASDSARRRLTRDLHDGAQQDLVNVLVTLQLAHEKWEDDPSGARELLGRAAEHAQVSIDELRDLAAGIHPEILANRGLAAAIESLVERLPLPVRTEGLPEQRLAQEIEASVYFFVSEALTNVIKHANARSAHVEAALEDERLTVDVSDDGVGGAQPGAQGTGLIGLGDRIAALDGRLTLQSKPGEGTTLHAVIPLEPDSQPVDSPK